MLSAASRYALGNLEQYGAALSRLFRGCEGVLFALDLPNEKFVFRSQRYSQFVRECWRMLLKAILDMVFPGRELQRPRH